MEKLQFSFPHPLIDPRKPISIIIVLMKWFKRILKKNVKNQKDLLLKAIAHLMDAGNINQKKSRKEKI